jgi:predicted nuclease of predicted toxin-antitoxin system
MAWAKDHKYSVITADLDFGAILAVTRASGPTVVQARIQDVRPAKLAPILIPVLHKYELAIAAGVLIVVDLANARVPTLPFG